MRKILSTVSILALLGLASCASAPKGTQQQNALNSSAEATLSTMMARDPSLRPFLEHAAAYVVFPEIAKGGVLIGGAYGEGVVFKNGRVVGYAELNQASIGAQLGGQSFAELIVLRDEAALQRLQAGNLDLGVEASAVALRSGAAKSSTFESQAIAFVMPRAGLMAELSLVGQQIDYVPL